MGCCRIVVVAEQQGVKVGGVAQVAQVIVRDASRASAKTAAGQTSRRSPGAEDACSTTARAFV